VTSTWLDVAELGDHLAGFRKRLFRLETLPEYAVDADGADFHRWISGEAEPTWARKRPWLEVLRADRAAGRHRQRVRILSDRLTDYERYACEWGYALNSEAGENIRVLRRGEHDIPSWPTTSHDWWIVDDHETVLMHYDKHGRFEAAEVLAVGHYPLVRDALWGIAEPFRSWWQRHPELHRHVAA
jgi:hypothetical protein